MATEKKLEIATLAGGCFWCTEAIFKRLKGVKKVVSGYSGGHVQNPTYEQVCNGLTGHAEAIQIHFDPKIIGYRKLLEVFFKLHDPTTLNRQGADTGPQYRSAVFYHDQSQKSVAEKLKADLTKSAIYLNPIVTEITPFKNFNQAENSHQNYYESSQNQPYCRLVIDPKIQKLYEEFKPITVKS